MNHASLFSGIGGFDLAAQWMGWNNIFHCEIKSFNRNILNYYWPHAKSYKDIYKTDFTVHRGTIDVLTGGFPCQPFSQSGKRKGNKDNRYLWPEMLRGIREIRAPWVIGENVPGLIDIGGGGVFEKICTDLESESYEVQPFIIPACAVGCDHRRDRIWIIAYSHSFRQQRGPCEIKQTKAYEQLERFQPTDTWSYISRPNSYNGKNGIPIGLDNSSFSTWRDNSNESAGNAIVPQVAYEIFKAIIDYEKGNSTTN